MTKLKTLEALGFTRDEILEKVLGGDLPRSAAPPTEAAHSMNGKICIVPLQRGFVVVGRFSKNGTECRIENGYIVRRWGTTKGLGQLATEGPQPNTVLDPIPTTAFHELGYIAILECSEACWASRCQKP